MTTWCDPHLRSLTKLRTSDGAVVGTFSIGKFAIGIVRDPPAGSSISAFVPNRRGESRSRHWLLRLKPGSGHIAAGLPLHSYWLPTINAASELPRANFSRAIVDLEAASPYELGQAGTFIYYLYPAYMRGQAYLLAHNGPAAAAEFQKLLDHRRRVR
jgi:hypothetical protein